MPGFKDQIAQDRAVFINTDEFAEEHVIDGNTVSITVDNDRLIERSKIEYAGVMVGNILYFAKSEDFDRKPEPEDVQDFDGDDYKVFDVREDDGMLEIILKGDLG